MIGLNTALRKTVHAAYRFVVLIDNVPSGAFTDCTLPSIEWDVEAVKEGGLNTYVHQLPGPRKAARISLKNGVGGSLLVAWYMEAMTESYTRRTITVNLLNPLLMPVMIWHISDALPLKWSGPQLRSDGSGLALQTLELSCGEISITPLGLGF